MYYFLYIIPYIVVRISYSHTVIIIFLLSLFVSSPLNPLTSAICLVPLRLFLWLGHQGAVGAQVIIILPCSVCTPPPSPPSHMHPSCITPQALFCGYAVILSTLPSSYRWLTAMNPGKYALNAWYQNEFKNNAAALGALNFDDLSENYGWEMTAYNSVACLYGIGLGYKLLSYVALKYLREADKGS